jgi:catechol 2,3-dioxygenase-like lactoylglutathione lyase family enzyme
VKQRLACISLVVRDYDEALAFYVDKLGFQLIEDTYVPEQNKRWVVVAPPGSDAHLLLAKAVNAEQSSRVGNQTGGRVFLFLYTDDFWRDYRRYTEQGVEFVREPNEERYGTVAVFKDPYGNLWDLLQPKKE